MKISKLRLYSGFVLNDKVWCVLDEMDLIEASIVAINHNISDHSVKASVVYILSSGDEVKEEQLHYYKSDAIAAIMILKKKWGKLGFWEIN